MSRRTIFTILIVIVTFTCIFGGIMLTRAAEFNVVPAMQNLTVNGVPEDLFAAFNINGNNYFKIRDVAKLLNTFDVDYENGKITLTQGETYIPDGSESTAKPLGYKEIASMNDQLYLNGAALTLDAYKIDGSNYFKLRDLGNALGFGVDFDEASQTVTIDTLTAPTASAAGTSVQTAISGEELELGTDITAFTLDNASYGSIKFEADDVTLTLVGSNTLNGKLKAKGNLTLTGSGSLTINSGEDDCINANGNIIINGGSLTLSTDDDAIHSDMNLTVNGGTINVIKSNEGLEGETVNIKGGTINVVSTDDGINASDGTTDEETTAPGRFGGDMANNSALSVNISGGTIRLYTQSDGIDSNGSVNITGGTVVVYINNSRDGDPIDANGASTLTPTLFVLHNSLASGAKLTVTNSSGKDVFSETLSGAVTSFSLTLPELSATETYTVSSNGTVIATVQPQTAAQGMMQGGGGFGGGNGGRGGGGFGGERGGGIPPNGGNGGVPPQV